MPTSGGQGELGQPSILAADSLDNFQQALNQQVCFVFFTGNIQM